MVDSWELPPFKLTSLLMDPRQNLVLNPDTSFLNRPRHVQWPHKPLAYYDLLPTDHRIDYRRRSPLLKVGVFVVLFSALSVHANPQESHGN